ncbi:MAG: DNA polymerase III subunit gamma/tau [Ilumatobacter sp.]
MATQSLYRRYRPRRFSELKGQDHIVRALRSSVEAGREGQAYLFSGPRGTGKTTTARIMAKVLNCQNPQGGEPCCECESCLSVEQGTSYDVHELDAASNNGVDAMRDLIEKASLGTPGRHRVYILDEVHMLSKGAEAALLKTLEEPPPHVVFVLATTDPQKMSDTIRSRTQHLQFHLLAPDTLQEHVRWVAEDAGLTVTDDAIEQVIAQGAGSPRDTLSALELVSNSGGAAVEVLALDEFVEAMIDSDPGRALQLVAHGISRGRDPRMVTEELIGFLRNGFLSLMAPDLVQLPSQRIDALIELARRLGPAGLVRGIEMLGGALTEMRNAPDPRVLLDVAVVQLTSVEAGGDDVASLATRLQRLERQVAAGAGTPTSASPAAPATTPPASAPSSSAPSASSTPPEAPARPVDPETGRARLGSRVAAGSSVPAAVEPAVAAPSTTPETPAPAAASAHAPGQETRTTPPEAIADAPVAASTETDLPEASAPSSPAAGAPPSPAAAGGGPGGISAADWDAVRPNLRGIARALYAPATFVRASGSSVVLALPNDAHRTKCEQHRESVEEALASHAGAAVSIELVADGGGSGGSGGGAGAVSTAVADSGARLQSSTPRPDIATRATDSGGSAALAHEPASEPAAVPHLSVVDPAPAENTPVVNGREIAEQARRAGPAPDPEAEFRSAAVDLPDDDEVDLEDLVDAPPEDVKSPIDRLAEAFPGLTEVEDDLY